MVHCTCHYYIFYFLRARSCERERSIYINARFLSDQVFAVEGICVWKNILKMLQKSYKQIFFLCSKHISHTLVHYAIYPKTPSLLKIPSALFVLFLGL